MEEKPIPAAKAARLIGCDSSTLRHALLNKQLLGNKEGRDWFVLLSDAEAWWRREKNTGGRPRKQTP